MKKVVNVVVAFCVLMTLVTTHIFAISQFADFDPKGVQWDVLDYVTSNKIIYGYEDGTFKPYATITRAEFTAMICRFFGYNLTEYATFDDVGSNHWASKYIQAGVSKNAINGVGDNKFAPDDDILIVQAMKILTVLAGCTEGEDMLAGYPVAYLTVAGKYGLYNNLVQKDAFFPMTRIDGAILIYNTYLYMKNKDVKKDLAIPTPMPTPTPTPELKPIKSHPPAKIISSGNYSGLNITSDTIMLGKIFVNGDIYINNNATLIVGSDAIPTEVKIKGNLKVIDGLVKYYGTMLFE